MKFRFYIVTEDGFVYGTNNEGNARDHAEDEMTTVIDAEIGRRFGTTGEDDEVIQEAPKNEA